MAARPENLSVGKYRFLVELGSGGMGDVFLAVAQGPRGFHKLQVIKRLRPELAQDPEFLAMFLNEARIAARLNHPNLVQTNEVSEHEDEYFIAMEYLEGQSLYAITKRVIATKQRFPLAMHLHVLAEACVGLHYAHELVDFDGTPLGLVHRDCSPQNVIVTYEGEVKVLDFGIAKAADSATITRTGVLKGKVPYMAPEQLEGARVDRRADVFSVGAMLWEAATGTRLWKGFNDIQIANRLQLGQVPRPREYDPTIDPKLDVLVMKALAPRADDRFQSAAELHAAIDQYVTRLGGVRRRDLGKHVSSLFTDTRRQLRAKLEEELRDLLPSWRNLLSTGTGEVVTSSGEHAAVEDALGSLSGATAAASPHAMTPVSSPSRQNLSRTPAGSREATPVSSRPGTGASAVSLVGQGAVPPTPLEGVLPSIASVPPSYPTHPTQGTMSLPSDARRGARSRAILLGALFAAVVAALVGLIALGRSRGEPDVSPATPPHGPESEPPARPTRPSAESTKTKASAVPADNLEPVDAVDAGPRVAPTATTKKPHEKPKLVGPAPTSTASAAPTGKPTLDKGDPWQ
ncbi:MAG: protein kinase [Deltaproteobacteria bacterium]|nr:protein kinase [Deltaproteobacteria bacterium]